MRELTIQKTLISYAVASALGLVPVITHADNILKIKIEDVGRTTCSRVYNPALDGNSGGFRFSRNQSNHICRGIRMDW